MALNADRAWLGVCAAVLRGAKAALDEPPEDAPSQEALEITEFVLRELRPLQLDPRAWWAPG